LNTPNSTSDLLNAFVERWSDTQEIYIKPCLVTAVHTEDYTIDVTAKDNSGEILGVKLKVYATSGTEDFFIPVPEVGSNAIVAFETPYTAVCLHASACSDFYINAGQTTINGGGNAGLINIHEITAKLNELTSTVNSFITKYNTHTHSLLAPGIPPLATPPIPNIAEPADNFSASDYEDAKVTH